MNSGTGEVKQYSEIEKDFTTKMPNAAPEAVRLAIKREWTEFTLGETITVKNIQFVVKKVSNQRLVLKFVNKETLIEK